MGRALTAKGVLVAFGLMTLSGCGAAPTAAPPPAGNSTPTPGKLTPEAAVRAAIAAQFDEVKPDQVSLDQPFGADPLKADELDVIEIVMETEEQLDVEIHDEALEKAAGTAKPGELPSKLTPRMLIEIAGRAPKSDAE